jgi:hypothetical protein
MNIEDLKKERSALKKTRADLKKEFGKSFFDEELDKRINNLTLQILKENNILKE